MMPIVCGVFLWGILFLLFMLHRNEKVSRERLRILDIVSAKARQDIASDREYNWRYKDFDLISYETMLFKFWIPVKDFYKNKKCIQ